jgi:S1-C subfamily serine protease
VNKHAFAHYDAIVAVKAQVPEDALTAGLLGTERSGHGVRIRDDGLIATIGYVIHEAENIWISAADGLTVPGFVVGYDFDSGFGLIKPALPFPGSQVALGLAADLAPGDPVLVATSGGAAEAMDVEVVARQEFAGRWEYLLEDAIFTAPPHQSWSGAALIDSGGRLCGLGSLIIQGFKSVPDAPIVNMFVPIELLTPVIEEICAHGRPLRAPRPWLGILACDDEEDLTIVGVYRNCPADAAGIKPGDIVMQVGSEPTIGLSDMLRKVWRLGSAGTDIPLTIMRGSTRLQFTVRSGDRATYLYKGTLQ